MESPGRAVRSGSPVTTVVRNQAVVDILTEIEANLNGVKDEMRQFLRSCHRYPMPEYLMTSSALFSAKMTLASIVKDAQRFLKTALATMFFRSNRPPVERPMINQWLVLHIADILSKQYRDFSCRNFFHVPSSTGYDVVYLDEHMMLNGRQIIYLCVASMQDENMAPSRFELFHRGPGLEDPDESHVRDRIIGQLYDFFRSNS